MQQVQQIDELTRSIISFGAYTVFAIAGAFAIIVIIASIRALLKVR